MSETIKSHDLTGMVVVMLNVGRLETASILLEQISEKLQFLDELEQILGKDIQFGDLSNTEEVLCELTESKQFEQYRDIIVDFILERKELHKNDQVIAENVFIDRIVDTFTEIEQ